MSLCEKVVSRNSIPSTCPDELTRIPVWTVSKSHSRIERLVIVMLLWISMPRSVWLRNCTRSNVVLSIVPPPVSKRTPCEAFSIVMSRRVTPSVSG